MALPAGGTLRKSKTPTRRSILPQGGGKRVAGDFIHYHGAPGRTNESADLCQ